MTIKGTKGNDNLTGTKGNDVFDLSQGGNDTVNGEAGNDKFIFGSAFTAKDSVNGGSGNDTLSLAGDYTGSHKIVFGAKSIVSVETIMLGKGHDYSLTTNDANVAKNKTLTVDASHLGAGNRLNFNGSHETDGKFDIIGGKGDDHLTGGAKADTFDLSHGGTDTASGGAGNDTFIMGAYNFSDRIDGGAGNDTVTINGSGGSDVTLSGREFTSVETLKLTGNFSDISTDGTLLGTGQSMTIDGSGLRASLPLYFDGSAEHSGKLHVIGGAGNDIVTAGAENFANGFTFAGGAGSDLLRIDGADGSDTLTVDLTHSSSIEAVNFASDPGSLGYQITLGANTVDTNGTLTIDASGILSTDSLLVDGSAVGANGHLDILVAGEQANLTGGAGADTFEFSGSDSAIENAAVNGNGGSDILKLEGGDHTLTLSAGSTHLSNLNEIGLASDSHFNITLNDGEFSADDGHTLKIADFGDVASLTFDASANNTDSFVVDGSTGNDTLTGGQQGDVFVFSFGGSDATFDSGDTIDGQGGSDTLQLNGDYSGGLTIASSMMTNVEKIQVEDGHSYNLTIDSGVAESADGNTLTVDASALTGLNTLTLDASADTTGGGSFDVTGGSGNDTLTLNSQDSYVYDGGAGDDQAILTGNGANDTLTYSTAGLTNIQYLVLDHGSAAGGLAFDITAANSTLASGQMLTVTDLELTSNDTWSFNGAAETDGGVFDFDVEYGHATLTGGSGADTFEFGASGTLSTSTVHGGAGSDTLLLEGGGYGGFSLAQINSVETIRVLEVMNNYSLSLPSGHMSDTGAMTINGSALTSSSLSFDASSVTSGSFTFTGGAGTDALSLAGPDVLAGSTMDGGSGNDTLYLKGDYSAGFTFSSGTLTSVEDIVLSNNSTDYNLTTVNANVANGATMEIDGSAITSGNSFTFDGSAETNGHFNIYAGQGSNDLTGGDLGDTFHLSNSTSATIHESAAQSASVNYDTFSHFDASADSIQLGFAVSGIDSTVSGSVSTATFDADLAARIGSTPNFAGAHDAIEVDATSGTLSGHVFLVIDANGDHAYTAGSDIVIDITGLSGTLSTGNFTT